MASDQRERSFNKCQGFCSGLKGTMKWNSRSWELGRRAFCSGLGNFRALCRNLRYIKRNFKVQCITLLLRSLHIKAVNFTYIVSYSFAWRPGCVLTAHVLEEDKWLWIGQIRYSITTFKFIKIFKICLRQEVGKHVHIYNLFCKQF